MCMVSAVSDYYMGQWPDPNKVNISREEYLEYQRLKFMATELDNKLNQPDCVKPQVDIWEKAMEDFLRRKGILK